MPEMQIRQHKFTSNACGLFTKNKKIMKKFKKREIQDPFIKTNWIELAFNMIWLMKIFKYLARRTAFDKVLSDKAFNKAKNLKYDGSH